MRIALVDDDAAQIETLCCLINRELDTLGDLNHKIRSFNSGEDFLASFKAGEYDLVVLDIYMGKLTGIEVAYRIRELDEHVLLAFCTSSNEYASESYEVGARHYLRKPITEDGISRMFRRLDLETIEKTRIVKLPDGKNVTLRKILYTEYSNHTVTVHLQDGESHRLRTSQGAVDALLMEHGFFHSPYKGITVSFFAVDTVLDDSVRLIDGTVLPITRRREKEFKAAYTKFRFDRMRKEVGA